MIEKIINKLSKEWNETSTEVKVAGASILFGLGMGAIGKATNEHWIPAIPPAMDLFGGRISPYTLPYALGVAINYLPEIYQAAYMVSTYSQ
ncbi:MAG: hypothetical protein ABIJ18_03635 [archaeon]